MSSAESRNGYLWIAITNTPTVQTILAIYKVGLTIQGNRFGNRESKKVWKV